MKQRFWQIEFASSQDGDPEPREHHTLTTDRLLETIRDLIERHDCHDRIRLLLTSHKEGTKVVTYETPHGAIAVISRDEPGQPAPEAAPRLDGSPGRRRKRT